MPIKSDLSQNVRAKGTLNNLFFPFLPPRFDILSVDKLRPQITQPLSGPRLEGGSLDSDSRILFILRSDKYVKSIYCVQSDARCMSSHR